MHKTETVFKPLLNLKIDLKEVAFLHILPDFIMVAYISNSLY
jgi:hypothetical protein